MNSDFSTRKNQRAERKRIHFTVPVTDAINEREFGHLGNLSASGMLVISTQAPRSNGIYQLRMELPALGTRTRHIEVGVQERWHDQVASGDQIWAGYRIISISKDDIALLNAWLVLPG